MSFSFDFNDLLKVDDVQYFQAGVPPTNYRVTFHENTKMEMLSDIDNVLPKPIYHYNQDIVRAHDLMTGDSSMSPYMAWALVCGYKESDLPLLLASSEQSVKYLISHPDISPPVSSVDYFCRKIGVHPAYLQPCLRYNDHSYHSSVMTVIANIATNEDAPQRDRELALKAMEAEREKFEKFERLNSRAATYMKTAYLNIEGEELDCALPSGIKGPFSDAVIDYEPDVDIALDFYERRLKASIKRVEAPLALALDKCNVSYRELMRLACVLYGDEKASEKLNVFIENMRDTNPGLTSMVDWGYEDDATLYFFHDGGEFQSPELHPNFEINARQQLGYTPDTVIKELIDHGLTYIDRKKDYDRDKEKLNSKLQQVEWPLQEFQGWRNNPDNKWQIPLFMNYKLVESVLGVKSAPAISNVPAIIINHEHIFPTAMK